MYKEILAKSALNRIDKEYLPYNWDLNIYRGCSHKCQYCFAMYSHKYLESEAFFDEIYVKTNIAEVLEKKLKSRSWKKEIINIGGVTDSYQGIEAKYKLMPKVWELLIKHNNRAVMSTKSKLILRDIELIAELSRKVPVGIAATIITTNEEHRRRIEPGTGSIQDRFMMLGEMKAKTRAIVGVHMMPIIPFLTDTKENIESVFSQAKSVGADYVITSSLNLYTETRKNFFAFIQKDFPELYSNMIALFKSNEMFSQYKKGLYLRVKEARMKYNIPSYSTIFETEAEQDAKQMSLF
ncbi:MAG: radical SAM protein [Candidatus Margulisbacteria bacterium GWF2_35_9]|nr:MAG: radical SAM protein [Candidatus Margulisbacteria bacterium GWF2_35_9]